jgi:transcriptional regulator with XRE-family HTH domain
MAGEPRKPRAPRLDATGSVSLPATETGQALGEILAGRGLSQYRAAKLAETSQPYLNQVATGRRRASAEWIDLVANALKLSPEEAERLHRAAAKDHGFRIDLTKK